MYQCGMRQMEEKHVAHQVDLMVWSNRLDLLAISNFKGEVQVHRLHWQKVWNLPPPKENVTVQVMTWRPDGKALAIGYSSGSLYIVDIEDKEILHKYEFQVENDPNETKTGCISCITWATKTGNLENATEYNLYDDATLFLQKPPLLNTYKNQGNDENIKGFKELQKPTQFNILIVGYDTGNIYISVFGSYPYGMLHLPQVVKEGCRECKLLNIILSDDFSIMQVLFMDKFTGNIFLSLVNTSLLSAYAEELFMVANKHSQVIQLLSYLDQTMISITEAWEHILLEMDTKMAYYASSVPRGGVSADLLELLMLGVPSDELELFLLQELTAKGLKKFGSSVELSYSTIQKLVLKQLNIVGQNLTFYLAELRGFTRIPDRYMILGLVEDTVTQAIKACCAFLNKCLELQQVIDVSMRNYKAFFRWLFVVIVRLLDEQTPSEIVKITQQDLTHIAEFLYNFDDQDERNESDASEKPVKFNLERLGQYLQDQDLTIFPDDEDNPWHKFLKENSCLANDNDTIFSMAEFRKYSLVQQHNYLKDAMSKVFDIKGKNINKYISVLYNIKCYENKTIQDNNMKISQIFDPNQQRFMMALVDLKNSANGICFMSIHLKENTAIATAVKYYFSAILLKDTFKEFSEESIVVMDIQFYSPEYLSVLIKHPYDADSSIFIQLPLKIAIENSEEFNMTSKDYVFNENIARKNVSSFLNQETFKILEKMDGFKIAVSGGRKVAVVLSKSNRKVRVFEMEVSGEDEEDETLDATPQSKTPPNDEASDKQDVSSEELFNN